MSKFAQDILLVPQTSPTFPSGKSWRTVTILYRKIKTGSLGCEVTSGRRGEFTQPDLRFFWTYIEEFLHLNLHAGMPVVVRVHEIHHFLTFERHFNNARRRRQRRRRQLSLLYLRKEGNEGGSERRQERQECILHRRHRRCCCCSFTRIIQLVRQPQPLMIQLGGPEDGRFGD